MGELLSTGQANSMRDNAKSEGVKESYVAVVTGLAFRQS